MNISQEYKEIANEIFEKYNQTQFLNLVKPKGYILEDFRGKYIWNLWYGYNEDVKFSVKDILNTRFHSYEEALSKIKWLRSELKYEFDKARELEDFKK